ncbi:TPA: hypothetical protein MNP25_005086 [Klebsiella pneumoniae]|nr:hypothetical protein [Klebsiella pneumoniae]HBZ9332276.1 hypothetical protein [Klebsiella pneumoniae]HBZ9696545.1 hypothetical protein [Klebsiella pneumoniae]HBZ9712955.1 hypothetical protein [Klebsiella pneumoniae]HBZ9769321.1 hypothetical protein [Klebsiella pneumoniae]
MTTDITELALIDKIQKQLENFDTVVLKEDEANALVEALEKAQRANAAQDDHINQQQDRIESLEKKNAELGKYAGGLESFRTAYMEWSDKTDWVQTDKRFDFLKPWGKHRADVLKAYIEHLESRTVKLPKPHAHLIWIQAGHAPDDYWDDVAVSHSEKDLCCDGSERYPVYARWEIEEMLAAAGIKVEQLS